jgi:hypothetical protein
MDILFLTCAAGYADIVVAKRAPSHLPPPGEHAATEGPPGEKPHRGGHTAYRGQMPRLVPEPSSRTALPDPQPSAQVFMHCPFAREGGVSTSAVSRPCLGRRGSARAADPGVLAPVGGCGRVTVGAAGDWWSSEAQGLVPGFACTRMLGKQV